MSDSRSRPVKAYLAYFDKISKKWNVKVSEPDNDWYGHTFTIQGRQPDGRYKKLDTVMVIVVRFGNSSAYVELAED